MRKWKASVMLIVLSLTIQGQGVVNEPRRFWTKRGFSIEAPVGWQGGIDPRGLPFLFNFPPASGLGKGLLPIGGATLVTVARPDLPRRSGDETITGWAKLDSKRGIPGTVRIGPLTVPPNSAIRAAVLASWDVQTFGSDDQKQHDTSVYWEFDQGFFATHLTYAIGDKKANDYEALLIQHILSIRPLQPKAK